MLHDDVAGLGRTLTKRCSESYVDTVEIGGLGHCGGTGNAGITQLEISVVYR